MYFLNKKLFFYCVSLIIFMCFNLSPMMKKIALIGEYNPGLKSHQATNMAIEHSSKVLSINIGSEWISAIDITLPLLAQYDGILIAPGGPTEHMDKTLMAIKHARENNIPCLGTCGGFQHIVIEYARNVLGYYDAQHAEYDSNALNLFIIPNKCSLVGKEMNVKFVPQSKAALLYNANEGVENYYCNFGVNQKFSSLFKEGTMLGIGFDVEDEMRIVDIPQHPFFIGTLFVPQMRSTLITPHPLITAFLKAVVQLKENK